MIGVDIVDISKFSSKASSRFLEKLFAEDELNYGFKKQNSLQTFAGIFAAKEAILKANNLNLAHILRKKIEIKHVDNRPIAFINNKEIRGSLSISHDGNYAIAICNMKEQYQMNISQEIKELMPKRKSESHKGDYGRIAILGGSSGMAGSVYMASLSAMRTGAGMAFILAPKSISEILQIKSNEQIIKEIDCHNFYYSSEIVDQILDNIEGKDTLIIGPGMGKGEDLNKLIGEIIASTDIDMVIDADGLNAISKDLSILKSNNKIILTPHMGEFSRLTGLQIDKIKEDEESIARKFAKDNDVVLVLKSDHTIVTDGLKFYKNEIGNPGMATAGVGDVLTGVIASLMKRLEPFEAAKLGVYIHSLAGDIASEKLGEDSLIATDVIENLSEAIKRLR
ncbi:NAD(P)H-hydrate dehydratase [Anaerococcus cruorum]|uniref:ADP-dependent (S)-NAD(P)H-hydrate dehydratase n=1 Tax=Anaerococcus cruorum TaxID=3115617 RepID=A0ABW9MWI5_9FIRM